MEREIRKLDLIVDAFLRRYFNKTNFNHQKDQLYKSDIFWNVQSGFPAIPTIQTQKFCLAAAALYINSLQDDSTSISNIILAAELLESRFQIKSNNSAVKDDIPLNPAPDTSFSNADFNDSNEDEVCNSKIRNYLTFLTDLRNLIVLMFLQDEEVVDSTVLDEFILAPLPPDSLLNLNHDQYTFFNDLLHRNYFDLAEFVKTDKWQIEFDGMVKTLKNECFLQLKYIYEEELNLGPRVLKETLKESKALQNLNIFNDEPELESSKILEPPSQKFEEVLEMEDFDFYELLSPRTIKFAINTYKPPGECA